jgi:hypothetical protein
MADEPQKPIDPTPPEPTKPGGVTITLPSLPSSWTWQSIIAWVLTLTGISITVGANIRIEVTTTPEAVRMGWAGPEAVGDAEEVRDSLPEFRIRGAWQDNTRRVVKLWDAARKVLGKDVPNYPQEIGDCVAFGAKNAVAYLQCVQLANLGGDELNVFRDREGEGKGATGPPWFAEYAEPSTSYIYGISRVQIGNRRLGRGDGSIGAWAAKGCQQFGVVTLAESGPYSGSQAKAWGYDGPPSNLLAIGKDRLVRTVSLMRTPDEVRDAICNGYPVTIASNFGTKRFDTIDGKLVARGDDNWSHQMCLIAYDGSGSQPLWYCLNSWGGPAHPTPLQGEPPGGFWITSKQLAGILRENDSFAFSAFDGFPSRDLNFNVFGDGGPQSVSNDPPPRIKVPMLLSTLGVGPMTGTGGGLSVFGMGLIGFVRRREQRKRLAERAKKLTAAVAVLVGVLMMSQPAHAADDPFNVFAVPQPREAIAAASFEVFTAPAKPIEAKRFDVFNCSADKSCDCLNDGKCDCGADCPCSGYSTGSISDYVEVHTRDGCGPCEQFKQGPLNTIKGWRWKVGPTGHVRVIKHPPDWPHSVPQFRFYRHGREFARRTGYMTEQQIAKEFDR